MLPQLRAAAVSNASAQACLGLLIKHGVETAKNWEEAAGLFRLAADQGHAGAQFQLGVCLRNGQGVK